MNFKLIASEQSLKRHFIINFINDWQIMTRLKIIFTLCLFFGLLTLFSEAHDHGKTKIGIFLVKLRRFINPSHIRKSHQAAPRQYQILVILSLIFKASLSRNSYHKRWCIFSHGLQRRWPRQLLAGSRRVWFTQKDQNLQRCCQVWG